jgi:hypothetical protein
MHATVLRIFLLIATGITLVCAQVCQTNADCQNGGICVTDPDGISVNRCDCTSSYTGNACEIDCGVLCYNDAECLVDIQEHVEMGFGDSEFSCKCKDGWQGFLCSIRVETCPDGLECLNGGDCIEIDNGSYRCDCPVGYDGQNCTALIEETTNPPSIATSNEDSTGCSVCGFGLYVSKPEAIFAYPEQPEAPCGMLQEAGLNGVIPLNNCPFLPALIFDVCGCAGMPEPDTPVDLTKSPSPSAVTGTISPAPWSPSNNMRGTALPSNESTNLSSGAVAGISVAVILALVFLTLVIKSSSRKSQKEDISHSNGVVETDTEQVTNTVNDIS